LDPSLLRRRAEALAMEGTGHPSMNIPEGLSVEIRQILHELQVHQIELEMQNEELGRAQIEIDAARERYFDLYDLAPVGYCALSEKGLILEANLTAADMLGIERGAPTGRQFSRYILPEDQDIFYHHKKQVLELGTSQSCELRMIKRNGSAFWTYLKSSIVKGPGGITALRVVMNDITERILVEDALKKANQENKDLLRELQHRAKNSFHMISSMIHIALSMSGSPEVKEALDVLDSRVRSISDLYSLLYSTGIVNEVRLDEYCAKVASPPAGLSRNITLKIETENITVPVKKAAPLGMIITELITNAVKYAFPGDKPGTITLRLKKTGAGVLLEVQDDGVGMSTSKETHEKFGTGLNLVKGLSRQVEGSFRMESGAEGTRCFVEFPQGTDSDN
jgi:PAS domain S-box-containing protein